MQRVRFVITQLKWFFPVADALQHEFKIFLANVIACKTYDFDRSISTSVLWRGNKYFFHKNDSKTDEKPMNFFKQNPVISLFIKKFSPIIHACGYLVISRHRKMLLKCYSCVFFKWPLYISHSMMRLITNPFTCQSLM